MRERLVSMLTAAMALFVEELVASLVLLPPFTGTDLRDKVQKWRGYRIDIEPFPMGDEEIYGLCVCKRPGYYVLFYRADATFIQQQRIIFHELCHIILSHVSPHNPMHVLRESLAATVQEQEAEIFSELMTRYALGIGAIAGTAHVEHADEPMSTDRFTRWLQVIGG